MIQLENGIKFEEWKNYTPVSVYEDNLSDGQVSISNNQNVYGKTKAHWEKSQGNEMNLLVLSYFDLTIK